MLENGWTFDDSFPGATGDTLYQHEFLYQLYLHADPHYSGRVTVPVLWDKKTTPSSATNQQKSYACSIPRLMRWVRKLRLLPPALQLKIDELNGWIYDTVNNGVYKAGFANQPEAYDEAVARSVKSLRDWNRF